MKTRFPNLNVLGAGYNVFERYADPLSSTESIVDLGSKELVATLGSYEYTYPENVKAITVAKGKLSTVYGSNITNYQSSFASQLSLSGSYGFFSSSIKASFATETSRSSFEEYFTLQDSIIGFKLILPTPGEIIKKGLLLPQFKQDLKSLSPIELFKKYGTHWVRSFLNGGKGTYNTITSKFSGRDKWQIEIDVEASFKRITSSGDIKVSSQAMSEKEYAENYESRDIEITGGDPSRAARVLKGGWDEWSSTVLSNPVLIDFDNDSLVPIWELCEDNRKRQELIDAYPKYASEYQGLKADELVFLANYCTSYVEKWRDKGSGADMDVTLFQPIPAHGFFSLGSVAVKGYPDNPSFSTLTVKPINKILEKALKQPKGYKCVYKDKGTGADQDGSIWKPIPYDGYVALGYVAQRGYDEPSVDQIMCVHEEIIKNATVGALIWNDRSSGGDQDCSLWAIKADSSGIVPEGLFIPATNYSKPADNLTYQILRKCVTNG